MSSWRGASEVNDDAPDWTVRSSEKLQAAKLIVPISVHLNSPILTCLSPRCFPILIPSPQLEPVNMSNYTLTSTSRALYRVFVAPNLIARPQISLQRPSLLPITSIRTFKGPRKPPAKRQAISDFYTFDNAIQAEQINLIDESGTYHNNINIDHAMRKYNRVTHHLLLITEGKTNELGQPDPENLPVCKIISKMELRNQYNRKIDIARKAERGPVLKALELNWAIAGGDLKHRLDKLQEFLRDGRKVEVTFGPKRRGKKATDEEAKSVLKAVEDAASECKGTGEVKREGVMGGVMTITYQGTDLEGNKDQKKATLTPKEERRLKKREKKEEKDQNRGETEEEVASA